MFEKLAAPDDVIAIRLSGKLTGEDVEQYKALFDEKLAKYKQIGVCIDLTGLSDMSMEAIVKDAKAEFNLFTHLTQLGRCACISDKEWPQALINLMKPLFPNFETRGFTSDQIEEALKWASEFSKTPKAKSAGFRFLPTSKKDVLAFEINGLISSEEMPGIIKEFETFLRHHDKVRLLNRMKHFGGIDPSVFMQAGLVSMKLAALQKVERYAVVGAPGWMCKVIGTLKPVFPDLDMRTFPVDQENKAWAWLDAEPSS